MSMYEEAKRLAGELHQFRATLPDKSPVRQMLFESAELLESLVNAERVYEQSAFAWTATEAKQALTLLRKIDRRLVNVAPMKPHKTTPRPEREIDPKCLEELACVSLDEAVATLDWLHGRDQDEMKELE